MSERDFEDNRSRGSSRSSFKGRDDRFCKESDDSRDKDKRSEKRVRRDRSRSRDRPRRRSRSREDKYESRSKRESDTKVREMSISPQREEGHTSKDASPPPPPPPAPRITKISIGFKSTAQKTLPIKMSLNAAPTQSNLLPKKPPQVASVFNDGSDEEPEEMPAEARMRMRNIGRDTPTSVGPNSFGKTKHGFCDEKAIFQKNLKEAMDKVNPTSHNASKFTNSAFKLSK